MAKIFTASGVRPRGWGSIPLWQEIDSRVLVASFSGGENSYWTG